MTKRTYRFLLVALAVALLGVLTACQSFGKEEVFGYSMGGIDHLADNLSVTDFWVNGAAGFQAGSGNAGVPAPLLPVKWHPGLTVHVVWDVRDWEHDKGNTHEADVPVDPYTEDGNLWVHFLANGTVRVVVSNAGPYAPTYPGPHDPIPRKKPQDMYPPRIAYSDVSEQFLDTQLIYKRCNAGPDPATCVKKARDKLLDDERADARRYLPRCATMVRDPDYEACKKQAWQSMREARLARRCQAAPDLSECSAQKAGRQMNKAEKQTGALNQ